MAEKRAADKGGEDENEDEDEDMAFLDALAEENRRFEARAARGDPTVSRSALQRQEEDQATRSDLPEWKRRYLQRQLSERIAASRAERMGGSAEEGGGGKNAKKKSKKKKGKKQ